VKNSRRAIRKSANARRQEILSAVFFLLAKGGVPAVSTPAIARRVGVTQSALFKHFRNKETLWRAVMDALALEVGSRFQAASQEGGSHAGRMFAIITAYLTVVKEIPAIPALMFAEPRQMHGAGKYMRQEITARFGWFHGALCEQIQAGMEKGEFRSDVDPKVAASMAAGIAQSLILRWRVSGGAIDMVGESEKVYPMFLVGIASPLASTHALSCSRAG
jgi:AcrR family transcriptional regulator